MSLIILHLSDIHITGKENKILGQGANIARSLYKHVASNDDVFILISGDITHSGSNEQFKLAKCFFEDIRDNLKSEKDVCVRFIVCPGNHDCNFSSDPVRSFMLNSMRGSDITNIEREVFEQCTNHQKEYFEFKKEIESDFFEDDCLWTTYKFDIDGKEVVFDSINLSWASEIKETQGKLIFPFSSYDNKTKISADIRISVMHHPINWLDQKSYRDFRSRIRNHSNFIFTGHEHVVNPIVHNDIESGETIIFEGGELQGKDIENSAFGVVKVNLNDGESEHYTYKFNIGKKYYEEINCKSLNCKVFNSKDKLNFSSAFRNKIDDCGGYYKNNNVKGLKLSDIFIYPNLKVENQSSQRVNSISSKDLLSLSNFSEGIILSGEDNVGSTSLIYSLISEYYLDGFIPVLLKGSDIKKNDFNNIGIQINKALKEQYINDDVLSYFQQESSKKKILLIDDFDDLKIKSTKSRNEVLSYLKEKFHKIVLTVDSMFEVNEMTSLEGKSETSTFDHFKIEQFNYQKRTELINKWYAVGQTDGETEYEVIGKCNQAEKLMDVVMDKSLISPYPIFLLTFLQSIETGQSSQLSDSALGHYYNFLLTQSFLDIGIDAESLGKELDYAMHLARFFNRKNTLEITGPEFVEFNTYFSETWQETSFEKKESILLRARVLTKNENGYEFRYLYNYYYLLGMYLSRNLMDENVRLEVEGYIEHLYIKRNANTILFLAHHSSADNILFMMKEATDNLFNENYAADFDDGCGVVKELIKDAPKLEYNNKTPQENRKNISERKDFIESKRKDDFSSEEDVDPLDLAAKITMLFKTVEILGQIIKSGSTKFERSRKVEIIKSLFLAPLRALQDFYNFLEHNPRSLIEAINIDLSKSDNDLTDYERDAIARTAVSRLIQGISSGFVIKIAQSINSEALMPDIPKAMGDAPSLAFELIALAISLDNHKSLDKRKIKDLHKKCEKNLVANKIFDSLVMNRLHLFKTSEKDMQWLQSELKYDLIQQHKIGYSKSHKIKRLSNS